VEYMYILSRVLWSTCMYFLGYCGVHVCTFYDNVEYMYALSRVLWSTCMYRTFWGIVEYMYALFRIF